MGILRPIGNPPASNPVILPNSETPRQPRVTSVTRHQTSSHIVHFTV